MRTVKHRSLALLLGLGLGVASAELITIGLLEPSSRRYLVELKGPDGSVLQAVRTGPVATILSRLEPIPRTPLNDTLRIGVFGASTTFGLPYAPPHHIWHWLELELEHLHPEVDVAFYNFGQPGIALRQVLEIANEVPPGFLDAAIVCSGNNEFLAEHAWYAQHARPATLPSTSLWAATWDALRALRSVDWIASEWERLRIEIPSLPPASAALIEEDPQAFRSRARVIAQASDQYELLARCLRRRVARVFFILPAGDLWNSAPGRSAFASDRSVEERTGARRLLQETMASMELDVPDQTRALLGQLIAVAPEVAIAHGLLAHLELEAGHVQNARDALARAAKLDMGPSWLAPPLRTALEARSRALEIPYLDVQALLDAYPHPSQIAPFFIDHCHPSIAGQQHIARATARALADLEWFGPSQRERGPRIATAEETAQIQPAEDTALALAAHLNFLVQLAGPLPRYSTVTLRKRFERLVARGVDRDWRVALEYAVTLGLLGEDREAEVRIQAVMHEHSEAAPTLGLMMRGSARLTSLMQRLEIDLKK